jgi:hypothetical protein
MASDTKSRIERLLDRYQELNPDRRWNVIAEIDRYSSHQADGIVPYLETLTELLKWESGGNAVKLAKLLESCLSEHSESIETETMKSLAELTKLTDEASQQVGLEALERLYRRDPDAINEDFSVDEIEDWFEGDPEERALGYRILGVTLADEAIPRLTTGFESEVEPVKEAIKEAWQDITSISATLIKEQNSAEAAKNLEQLADCVPEITVEYQAALRQGIQADPESVMKSCATALIRLGYSEYCEQLDDQALFDVMDNLDQVHAGRAAGVVIGGQPEVGQDVIPTIVEQIRNLEGEDRQRIYLTVLLRIAARSPELVAQYADRLQELDSHILGQARIDYLDLLGAVISHVDNPGRLAPLLIKELGSSNTEHVKEACKGLTETNLYPLPHAVNRARNSENSSISSVAHKIYQRSEAPEFTASDHLTASDRDSAVGKLESALHYQTQTGRWNPFSLPPSERHRLATVREQYQNDSGGYMLLPHDVPEVGILPAVELALSGIQNNEPQDILIYTPGTGSQWGTYGNIKKVFRNFGLASDQGTTTAALPLDEIVSVCRVVDGEVTEWDKTDSNTRIILTRSLEDIQTADLDAIVCNFLGRRPARFEAQLDVVQEELTSVPVFSLYSFTAKIEAPGTWPEYGYPETVPETSPNLMPGAPSIAQASESTPAGCQTPGDTVTTQLELLCEERSFIIEQLGTEKIAERLKVMHYLALEMDADETGHVASAFKKQTRFVQSLPVPLDMWDEWVRDESTGNGPYSIDPSYQRIDNIDDLREDPPNATVPGTVYEYLTQLQELFEILRQHNPTYHRLLREIESCKESDESLAVLFRKRSSQQAFKYALRENHDLSATNLSKQGIHILRPDSLRQLNGIDNIIITHPLPPSETQFYLSPLYETMRLIGYEQGTDEYVRESIETRRDTLRTIQEVPEGIDWPVEPTIDAIAQTTDDSESDREIDREIERREIDSDGAITEMWAQFEPGVESEPGVTDTIPDTPDERDNWTVQIMTEQGVELLKASDQSVLVERTQGPLVGSQYVWVPIEDLQPNDDFILIPDQVREQLFRQALESMYGDKLEGSALFDGLGMWWKTLRGIASEYDDPDTVYTLLEQNGIEKSEDAIADWFDAVSTANRPLDLPMNPDLRIGPDSADDIRIIGETFDYPDLVENARSIERTMELSRGKNRSKGKEINNWIVSRIQDADSELPGNVSKHTVGTISHLGRQR